MYCSNCGKEVPSDAKFCRYCGEPVAMESITGEAEINDAENSAISEAIIPVRTKEKRSGGLPIKTIIIVTIVFLAGVIASIVITRPPEGALNQTFKIAYIDPSETAYFTDRIYLPVFNTVYINTSEYEEIGFGIPTQEEASEGISNCMTIECNKDNSFEMHFFDEYAYGTYYYDEGTCEITFYVDGYEYTALYAGGALSLYSDDDSRFEFH